MTLEDAKLLVSHLDNKLFQSKLASVQGVLGKKLRQAYLYRTQGVRKNFDSYLVEGEGLKKGKEKWRDDSPYLDYRESDDWSWQYLTGPNSYDEFYYGTNELPYYPMLFHMVFESYVSLRDSDPDVTFEHILSCGDSRGCIEKMGNELVIDNVDYYACLAMEGAYDAFCDCEDEDDWIEPDGENCLEGFLYAMWYLEICLKRLVGVDYPYAEANRAFRILVQGTDAYDCSLQEYIDAFLEKLESFVEIKDNSSLQYVLPILERAYLSCKTCEEGGWSTLHTYVFTSKNIWEYHRLREECSTDSEIGSLLEILYGYVVDPLKLAERSMDSSLVEYQGEVYAKSFFAPSEYVCGYLFFPDDETGRFHPLLREIRGCFDFLLPLFKKEMEKVSA